MIIFVVAEITVKVAVITSSVAKIIFVVVETTLVTSSEAKIIFVVGGITFKVAVIIKVADMSWLVTKIIFCSGCDNF